MLQIFKGYYCYDLQDLKLVITEILDDGSAFIACQDSHHFCLFEATDKPVNSTIVKHNNKIFQFIADDLSNIGVKVLIRRINRNNS